MNTKLKNFSLLNKQGFTLIELLTVITILGLLSSIVIAAVSGAKDKARIAASLQYADSVRASLTGSLMAYWKFDENTGTTATDNLNNIILNLSGTWVNGIIGSAYQFNNAGWISTTLPNAIGQAKTYSFWFKIPTGTTDFQGCIMCVEDETDTSLEDNLGQTSFGLQGCNSFQRQNAAFNISDDKWHYFVFSKTSDTKSKLCLDGNCIDTLEAESNSPNIKRIQFNGGCGCAYGNFSDFGIIVDEVMIFSDSFGL